MTDLTSLTLAEARDRLRRRDFTASELTRAHLAAMERARALNAYVLETPEQALAMAAAADARLQAGDARPLDGIALGVKDLFATEGVRTTACSHILDNFVPTYESTVTANLWRDGAVMLGKLNNDEFAMGSSNETLVFRAGDVAWRRKGCEHAAGAGRLLRRLGRGGGGQSVPGRDRHRHRRLDPTAGGVHRHRRHQADLRPLLALGHRRLSPPRSIRPGRSRARCATARSCCARWPGTIPKDTTSADMPVPDYEAAVGRSVRGMRIGIPKEYRVDGMSAEIDRLWQQGAEWLKAAGAEVDRGIAAAHEVRVGGLLHRRAGGGVLQSRALRRRPLRLAGGRPRHLRHVSAGPARKASARRCAGAS